MIKDECFTLYNGVLIPKIGFGTWQVADGEVAYEAVLSALKHGYRHIDTAYAYGNEQSIARAIQDSHIDRKELFITTKLPASIKSYEGAFDYFNRSLKNLNTDYIDLYLIHAPWPWEEVGKDCTEGNIEVWKAFVELYKQKKVRAIGVSNFHPEDIVPLIEATKVKPMVNQIRYFIGNTQEKVTTYCQENDILVEAYSPLATGSLLNNEILLKMAEKYQVSLAQLCIRYCLEKNTLPLPKSTHEERILSNIAVDFTISKEDMEYLDSLKGIGPVRYLRS